MTGPARLSNTVRTVHAIIATILLCLACVAYTHATPDFPRFFVGINDFLPRYAQARMVGTGQMYDIPANYREQDRAAGLHIAGAYPDRMPWQAALMAPFCRMPYRWAYWTWIAINLAGFAALVWMWLLPRDLVLWGAVFFPAAAGLIVGQEGILLALALAGVLHLIRTRRDLAAGLLLSLCAAKPHLFLLVPLVLMVHRRWRIVWGATLGTAALLFLGTVAGGLDWPMRLLAVLRTIRSGPVLMPPPTLFQFGVNSLTLTAALILAVLAGVLIWRTSRLETGIGIAVLASLLIAPHTAVYDFPLLLVALPLLPMGSISRWIRIALLTPLPYSAVSYGTPWSVLLPALLLAAMLVSTRLLGSVEDGRERPTLSRAAAPG